MIERMNATEEDAQLDNSLYENLPESRSYFLFSKSNPIRKYCSNITSSDIFDYTVLFVIVFSSLKLVFDTYIIDEP